MLSVIFTDAVKSVAAMGGHSIALWSSLHRLRDLSSVKKEAARVQQARWGAILRVIDLRDASGKADIAASCSRATRRAGSRLTLPSLPELYCGEHTVFERMSGHFQRANLTRYNALS